MANLPSTSEQKIDFNDLSNVIENDNFKIINLKGKITSKDKNDNYINISLINNQSVYMKVYSIEDFEKLQINSLYDLYGVKLKSK